MLILLFDDVRCVSGRAASSSSSNAEDSGLGSSPASHPDLDCLEAPTRRAHQGLSGDFTQSNQLECSKSTRVACHSVPEAKKHRPGTVLEIPVAGSVPVASLQRGRRFLFGTGMGCLLVGWVFNAVWLDGYPKPPNTGLIGWAFNLLWCWDVPLIWVMFAEFWPHQCRFLGGEDGVLKYIALIIFSVD